MQPAIPTVRVVVTFAAVAPRSADHFTVHPSATATAAVSTGSGPYVYGHVMIPASFVPGGVSAGGAQCTSI